MPSRNTVIVVAAIVSLLGAVVLLAKPRVEQFVGFMAFGPAPAEPEESPTPLSVDAAIGQDMIAPGGAVMPGDLAALDLSVYNRELSRNIPIEIGMDRYLAKDELLLFYNAFDGEGPRPRVSSTERIIDGAGLFIIRRTGLADDSVAAEETMIRIAGNKVVDFGTRIKCARGPNTTQWTTELCP